ncbi:MAG: hypothetical protein QM714_04040 [Nocardioides sp.]
MILPKVRAWTRGEITMTESRLLVAMPWRQHGTSKERCGMRRTPLGKLP